MARLMNSIREFGCVQPIIVNTSNEIIGGHQRVEAAKAIGLESLPIITLDIPRKKQKALNIALNKIGGEFDNDKLSALINELVDDGVSCDDFGFSQDEINKIVDEGVDDKPLKNSKVITCPECGHEF